LIRLSDRCYIHVSYYDLKKTRHFPANGLVYILGEEAVVVDTAWTEKETGALLDWLKDGLGVRVAAVVVTHWHVDCMGGLAEVHRRNIPSYAHQLTREAARRRELPVPVVGFSNALTLRLGDHEIECRYPGPGHTRDNIVVWIGEEKLLFGGCLLKATAWRALGYLGDAVVEQWPCTLKKVLKAFPQAEIVIPGHGRRGGLELIHHTIDLLRRHSGSTPD
jgi:metallo-beta-lactamase class B